MQPWYQSITSKEDHLACDHLQLKNYWKICQCKVQHTPVNDKQTLENLINLGHYDQKHNFAHFLSSTSKHNTFKSIKYPDINSPGYLNTQRGTKNMAFFIRISGLYIIFNSLDKPINHLRELIFASLEFRVT